MEQGCWGQLLVCIQEALWSLLLRYPLELSLQLLCPFNSDPLGKKHQESRRMKGDSSSQLSLTTQYKLYIQRKAPAEGQGRAPPRPRSSYPSCRQTHNHHRHHDCCGTSRSSQSSPKMMPAVLGGSAVRDAHAVCGFHLIPPREPAGSTPIPSTASPPSQTSRVAASLPESRQTTR